jgi:hypothetical protein
MNDTPNEPIGEEDNKATTLFTKDDLIELVRAIKFSNADASIRDVHNEITTKMSQNESFEFLSTVKLNDVKKVWKKAITGGLKDSVNVASSTSSSKIDTSKVKSNDERQSTKSDNDELLTKAGKDGIIKFYTVGDGSIKTLAKNYTLQAAALAATQEHDEEMNKYVHCFLGVPADCSGGKPHQALINFNDNNRNGSKRKVTNGGNLDSDNREIVKIQVAAPLQGMDNNTPMLLYNLDRSAKTFIHDDHDDENKGYSKIKKMIDTHGVSGVLGGGGTKAYFYSRITRRKGEKNLISIDVTELAPVQNW